MISAMHSANGLRSSTGTVLSVNIAAHPSHTDASDTPGGRPTGIGKLSVLEPGDDHFA